MGSVPRRHIHICKVGSAQGFLGICAGASTSTSGRARGRASGGASGGAIGAREEEKGNIQGYYATVISEFKEGLSRWLEKETENETIEEFEDRELDALLLKG